jgi:1-acyl-sn-glycerol-3-phosphate acyltransferase
MMQQTTWYQGNKISLYLRSALLLAGMVLSLLIFSPIIMFGVVLPFRLRYRISRLWAQSVLWLAKICCGLNYEIEGMENIDKVDTAIVLSKHQSAWETIAFRYFLPMHTVLLKRSLLWLPLWGWAMATLRPIAIDRKNQRASLRLLLEQGADNLKQGLWVLIFPEGTRTAPGESKKFSAGGALLAQQSGVPVIPVAHNAGIYWPRYSFLKYPGTIKVKIGPLIEPQGRKAHEINTEAEAWIMQAMQEIGLGSRPNAS